MQYTVEDCKKDTKTHIHQVRENITTVIGRLITRRLMHDLSKLENPELAIFVKYTPKLKNLTYGSDKYKQYLKEMQVALDHHYQVNRHHPEHFKGGIEDMDLVDVVEMFCDWLAATKRHVDGDIHRSIKINQVRFKVSPQLASIFTNTAKNIFNK